ncbi:MAG: PrpF protein [Synergistaceae bacterium]|jgi:2-methylaconitate cis-trans-isomerase PrpF|nr:PrpF protein [Synergistaceae bacterium]
MRKFRAVFMRGGTSKGLIFRREDLPEDQRDWDSIFLQAMGNPDVKQIDGLGGTVSSNNKIVVVWRSEKEGVDVEYLVGQVVVGKDQVDYKANCGNMTSAVGPFALDEGLVQPSGDLMTVRLFNKNTDKKIDVSFPLRDGRFALEGNCKIAGIDGTAAEIKVNFLDPAGAKTGCLLPTGKQREILDVPGVGKIDVSIIDISGPFIMVNADDIGLEGIETPEEINSNAETCEKLEKIRGLAACTIGMACDMEDASANSPALPKIGVCSIPKRYKDLSGRTVDTTEMDLLVRVMSVFKCHKASPLTAACAIAGMAVIDGTIPNSLMKRQVPETGEIPIRIAHPSGVMTMYADLQLSGGKPFIAGVAAQRTSRRIMDGTVYIRK